MRPFQSDSVELLTLRKACQLQKQDLENLELKMEDLKREAEKTKYFLL